MTSLNFTNESVQCPGGLRYRNDHGVRTCGINSTTAACSSLFLPTDGLNYSRVCGMVQAYQVGTVDAFGQHYREANLSIDYNYVDGVSLTYGKYPRSHIWTFAAALDNYATYPPSSCACIAPGINITVPSFIGNDYFCESGAGTKRYLSAGLSFYGTDPLWDGAGCIGNSKCCSFNNPPWFYKQLPSLTMEDIEMRVCSDEGMDSEDIALSLVEIFVQ